MSARSTAVSGVPWWGIYGVVCVIHLGVLAADASPWDSITKCLAVPVLIGWSLQPGRAPRLLPLALLFCLGGDFFLELPDLFVVGMASFALAHVCFIALFIARGAGPRLARQPFLVAVLALAAVALVVLVWNGIDDPVVRVAVPVYALLLSGTAATALVLDRRAGIGAVLFLVSDAIIALTEFGRIDPNVVTRLAIMVLYLAAVALLTVGAARLSARPQAVRS